MAAVEPGRAWCVCAVRRASTSPRYRVGRDPVDEVCGQGRLVSEFSGKALGRRSWHFLRQRRNGFHRVIGTLSGRWLKSSMTLSGSSSPAASAAGPPERPATFNCAWTLSRAGPGVTLPETHTNGLRRVESSRQVKTFCRALLQTASAHPLRATPGRRRLPTVSRRYGIRVTPTILDSAGSWPVPPGRRVPAPLERRTADLSASAGGAGEAADAPSPPVDIGSSDGAGWSKRAAPERWDDHG